MFDRECPNCHKQRIDCWEPVSAPTVVCECGHPTERVWLGKAGGVIPDGIPGGLWIKNGLCNSDGTPRRYDSYSDIRKEEKRRGMENHVTHIGAKGSDKSKHTSKWY